MPGTPARYGPAFVASSATNILNPPSTQYYVVTRVHLVNQDSSARTVSLWIGATGASADGTEFLEEKSIPANDVYDMYGRTLLKNADFLVGLASVASMVAITIDYEAYVLP